MIDYILLASDGRIPVGGPGGKQAYMTCIITPLARGVPRSESSGTVLSHAVHKMMEDPSEAVCRD